tara:strand:- start:449 stop:994 length:546 start_codon:yes stop_codon:yes gene_type:complete
MKFVKIINNGEMIDMDESINLRNINKVLSALSDGSKIQHLYTWKYDDNTIVCYGCCKGSAGNENKHDLPPEGEKRIKGIDNSDTQLLFGDVYILMKNKKLCDIDTSTYGLFYTTCFGGFDDCVSSEELSDEELSDEELNDFIVNDDALSNDALSTDELDYEPSGDEETDEDIELDEDDNLY